MKQYRTLQNNAPIWKFMEEQELDRCPECRRKNSLKYLGFAQNYSSDLQGKVYQCRSCESWVDVLWSKASGSQSSNRLAGV